MLLKAVLEFFEIEVGIPKLRLDSKAAKAICSRFGVGTVRHLETKVLWMQALTKAQRLKVWKIDGVTNIADIGTKVLAKDRLDMLLDRANVKCVPNCDKVPESKTDAVVSQSIRVSERDPSRVNQGG